jgi:DEAD/DEAH box helicase
VTLYTSGMDLSEHEALNDNTGNDYSMNHGINGMINDGTSPTTTNTNTPLTDFAGLSPLSAAAQSALTLAQFTNPTTIQSKAIPILSSGQSAILHAATGSGKTLAYLLPFTERLWYESSHSHHPPDQSNEVLALILTPSRELAAQVAGIATILAPPGTVRFVTRPMNLLSRRKQERTDGTDTTVTHDTATRIYVGSAKAIYQSLYGDGRMPASPTTKPEAMYILQNTGYLVLDEVDRLLGVVGGVNNNSNNNNPSYGKKSKSQDESGIDNIPKGIVHEKPAAILTAAVARLTLGKATTVAASATVGRPLRRELARCMGLIPQECPIIVRDSNTDDDIDITLKSDQSRIVSEVEQSKQKSNSGNSVAVVGRAVTIPATVTHYVIPVVDGTSPGKILTTAFTAIQALGPQRRMLLVLTRNFGITTQNAIGALKHFKCQPEPISLLDALETTDGTEAMMEVHRQVTGVSGVGGSQPRLLGQSQQKGYLLVTGEDSVRGLHLDGLDVVLVASRSVGPDEYTHIAGRTGRAGKSGCVINIVSDIDASKVTAWEKMLNITFIACPTAKEIGAMIGKDMTSSK